MKFKKIFYGLAALLTISACSLENQFPNLDSIINGRPSSSEISVSSVSSESIDSTISSESIDSTISSEEVTSKEIHNEVLKLNFLELGVYNAGDATYIKAGDVDILIDAGAKYASATTLTKYIDKYCTDGKLEYVIATHAHEDHISGFAGNSDSKAKNYKGETVGRTGILYYYDIGTIIDFAKTNKTSTGSTTLYGKYLASVDYAVSKGAVHYNAQQCIEQADGANYVYQLTDTIKMTILDNRYYRNNSDDENNYSVCTMFTQETTSGDRNFLLTGDLEEDGETYLVKLNNLPKVELYKGGHHGSKTSSNDVLLNIIQPKKCAVCCCAGSSEYTTNADNEFPTQAFINRIAKWTSEVYVTTLAINNPDGTTSVDGFTSMNGDIVVTSDENGVNVNCSNNNIILKESEWFSSTIYVDSTGKVCAATAAGAISRPARTWPANGK